MRITFVNDLGQSYTIEIDPQMELENIMALLEADSGIPVAEQSISFQGTDLVNPKATISECGVGDDAVLLLRRKVTVAGRTIEQDAEMMRLQLLGDPELMRQLREKQPDLAAAASSDPAQFARLLRQTHQRLQETEIAHHREVETLNADPFDVEAQRRIEEAIRHQAVMENLQHAMEYSPEFFGKVTMLYIQVEVNGTPIKAFVDSGAQQTIMSPECAEACGIMRLLDTRFSGIAKGVGTARILGRVHSAQMKLADLFLPCAFTIMEGRDVDLLFGLDMLKAHQACIDLEKGVLRIQGREVPYLPEHELPDSARYDGAEVQEASSSSQPTSSKSDNNTSSSHASRRDFPGSGHALGAPSASSQATASSSTPHSSRYPEKDINVLVGLGVSREEAIRMLDATNGSVDMAASLMFSG